MFAIIAVVISYLQQKRLDQILLFSLLMQTSLQLNLSFLIRIQFTELEI